MENTKYIEFITIPYEPIKNIINKTQRLITVKPIIIMKGIRFIKENK